MGHYVLKCFSKALLLVAALVFSSAAIATETQNMPATLLNFTEAHSGVFTEVVTSWQSGSTQEPLGNVIDQNQPSGSVYMAAFVQTDLAQSFMQTNDNISGAGILLQPGIGTTDNVTIQLWDGLPNAGGTMLAEASEMGTQGEWVDVYWSAVFITPMTTYYLVFTGNTTLGIAGDISNPYPYGCVYANPGYVEFPDYDYAFRTYWDDEVAVEARTWADVKSLFD